MDRPDVSFSSIVRFDGYANRNGPARHAENEDLSCCLEALNDSENILQTHVIGIKNTLRKSPRYHW